MAESLTGETPLLTSDERSLLNNRVPVGGPTPELRTALAKVRPYLELIRSAAAAPTADFGLDRSQGVNLLLPHLRELRQAARILSIEAYVRTADGDTSGAVDAIAAMSRLAGHLRSDRLAISSVACGAILSLQDDSIDRLLSDGAIAREDVDRLAEVLAPLRTSDAIRMADSLRGYSEMLQRQVMMSAENRSDLSGVGADGISLDTVAARASVEQLDGVFDRAIDAISNPDRAAGRDALADLDADILRRDKSFLVALLAPNFMKLAEASWRTDDMIAARCRMLDDLRSGKVALDHFANAALVYLDMALLVEGLPIDAQRAIEAVRLAPTAIDADTVADADRALRPMREELHALVARAATRSHCDFRIALRGSLVDAAFVPCYVRSLRGALRCVLADAVAIYPLDDIQAAQSPVEMFIREERNSPCPIEEAVAAALRCAMHLGRDPSIGHAVAAASLLDEAHAALEIARERGSLDEQAKERLRAVVAGIDRSEPLGFKAALEAGRRVLVREAGRWPGAGIDATDPDRVGDDPLLRLDANAVATALLAVEMRRAALEGSDRAAQPEGSLEARPEESLAARLRAWPGAEVLEAPVLGMGDLVVAPSAGGAGSLDAESAIDAVRTRLAAWLDQRGGDRGNLLLDWRNELEALPRAPGIDVQLRMNQAGARLAVIDDLLRPSTRPAVGDDRAP